MTAAAAADDDDILVFKDEEPDVEELSLTQTPWKILVVDDDEGIHQVTRLALDDFVLEGVGLSFLKATGLENAKEVMAEHDDVAVVLLDVVMSDGSGLDLVGYIRQNLKNSLTRIVLRTGLPGDAPAKQVIVDYDVNDYWEKTELTAQRLYTTIATALRSYRDLKTIASLNADLRDHVQQLEERTLNLQTQIEQRKHAEQLMQEAQRTALKTAQAASKAEFATSVLHNIGNVLNSVAVGSTIIERQIKDSSLSKLDKVFELLAKNITNPGFFTSGGQGVKLGEYVQKVSVLLKAEHEKVGEEADNILQKLDLMKSIIVDQQSHAKNELKNHTITLGKVLHDSIDVAKPHLEKYGATLECTYEGRHKVIGNESEMAHVLINILKNGAEAMADANERRLVVDVDSEGSEFVTIGIRDSGLGIAQEHLGSMFTRGFTTKDDGHGFGLHYCSQVVKKMGGHLSCESDGLGQGTRFNIRLRRP
jgi:two-component system, NtrC family, sensor kinase